MNSHELVGVVDAGGDPGPELFFGGHLCHLILLRPVPLAVSVLAVVRVAHGKEPSWQLLLKLGGNPSVLLGEHTGADAVGPGILLGLQLVYDDLSGPDGDSPVWVLDVIVAHGGRHEPSELLSVTLELGLLLN